MKWASWFCVCIFIPKLSDVACKLKYQNGWILFLDYLKNTLVVSCGVFDFLILKSFVENKFYHFGSQHLGNRVMGKKHYVFLMFSTNALNSELKYFLESKNILCNLQLCSRLWLNYRCLWPLVKDEIACLLARMTQVFHELSITVCPVKPRTSAFDMQNEVKDSWSRFNDHSRYFLSRLKFSPHNVNL